MICAEEEEDWGVGEKEECVCSNSCQCWPIMDGRVKRGLYKPRRDPLFILANHIAACNFFF